LLAGMTATRRVRDGLRQRQTGRLGRLPLRGGLCLLGRPSSFDRLRGSGHHVRHLLQGRSGKQRWRWRDGCSAYRIRSKNEPCIVGVRGQSREVLHR
jgi:hypothetical protein